MSKFHLRTETILQGDFKIQPLNLILIFQVNCPGCFIYALPLAAKLHQRYGAYINVLGLSTAFEDFELNTAANTQKLLQTGEMIGFTRQYFQKRGTFRYDTPLEFPVAFDRETFTLNPLQGTPSWVLFDADYNTLGGWFGHKSEAEINAVLEPFIEKHSA
ncbi:MAG: hypothetical protein AAGC93_27560 [Cyanobacteria bacterium P01_F01_bin.53]